MHTQARTNGRESTENYGAEGRRAGRGNAGYTLLLERMTLEQWDAFRAGELDADTLREQVLGDGDDSEAVTLKRFQ